MFQQLKVINFDTPTGDEAKDGPGHSLRAGKFVLGTANKRLMQRVLIFNGLTPATGDEFCLMWASSPETESVVVKSPFQRINHFPMSKKILGNKAALADIIQCHPKYKQFKRFFPLTYILPDDRDDLFNVMKARPTASFIAKPPDGSCGHGIRLVNFSQFYSIPRGAVVQEYIARPLCIDGFKFDLRIYVLVTSFSPLRAFVYKDGLARFATESYSNYSKDIYSHLTNATLNKHGRNWSNEFKWKLTDLLAELRVRYGRSETETMDKIIDIVQQTLAFVQPTMASRPKQTVIEPYFELYGFDLLIDCNFDFWLLEINTNPSMCFDSDVDKEVKPLLLSRTLSIVGISDMDGMELKSYEPEFDVETVDIAELERELVACEDERNESSGSGFIRIFPTARAEPLMRLCTKSNFATKAPPERKELKLEASKIAQILTSNQATQLLVKYLSVMEGRLRSGELSGKSITRLHAFLVAQGFDSRKVSANLKTILHNYIIRQRTQLAMARTDSAMPIAIQKQLEKASTQTMAQILSSCTIYAVRDLSTLFS